MAKKASRKRSRTITTLAVGEEGPHPTTLALGEEGPHPTTLVVGEAGPHFTTLMVGEEGPHPTTKRVGEEGPTTKRVGEEGATSSLPNVERPDPGSGPPQATKHAGEDLLWTAMAAVLSQGVTTEIAGEEQLTTMAVGEEGPLLFPFPTIRTVWGEGPIPTWPLGEHWPPSHPLLEHGPQVPHIPPGWPVEARGVAAVKAPTKRRAAKQASKRRKRR